jgi:Icc protein
VKRLITALAALFSATCFLPAEQRVELDREVGEAEAADVSVRVDHGFAAVRALDGQHLELWAQAPRLRIHLDLPAQSARPFRLDVLNCMMTATLSIDGGPSLSPEPIPEHAAGCRFSLSLDGPRLLDLFPSSEDPERPFVFAVLSDVQSAVGRVHEVFERMNQDSELQFVVSTGDLVDVGTRDELVRFQSELSLLEIPFFSTVGNHEMGASPRSWHELFGLFNVHFDFAGVAFSLVDSGNGTIDPEMYERLDDWLAESRPGPHIVLTHVPPLDPSGLRGGGFRSRKEAAKFLSKLGDAQIEALFLGHIHSYYAFSSAGVPAYISGGGGAIQEQLDGIERHYLRVHVNARSGITEVGVVRID